MSLTRTKTTSRQNPKSIYVKPGPAPPPARVPVLQTFSRLWERHRGKRIFCIYGGAGSGKSMAVAQRICRLLCEGQGLKILVVRKTLPALRITAYQLIQEILDGWHVPYLHNKTERIIQVGPNSIYFTGLDDREKIKSTEYNYEWVEEASEIAKKDFLQLNLRLRRKNPAKTANQLYMTFNPVDSFHWLITDIIEAPKQEKVAIHHSTWRDNPFLDQEYIDELEGLAAQDANYHRVYNLGLPGVLENVIYKNYIIETMPPAAGNFIVHADALGLDFGFNNQMALLSVRFYEGRFFLKELFYETGKTTADLVTWMQAHLTNKNIPIYADAAEPDRIEELCRAGFNAWPADKEVGAGIDYCQAQDLVIDPDSPNLITEIRNYKFREDKDGRVLDEPVKFRDHLMDAARYALYTMNAGGKEPPLEVLGKGKRPPGLKEQYVEGQALDLDDIDEDEGRWEDEIPGLA